MYGYTKATDAEVCCEDIIDALSYDAYCNATASQDGYIVNSDSTACIPRLCAENEYVSNHTCQACSAGTTNAVGDDASGNDTSCDVDCVGNWSEYSECSDTCGPNGTKTRVYTITTNAENDGAPCDYTHEGSQTIL